MRNSDFGSVSGQRGEGKNEPSNLRLERGQVGGAGGCAGCGRVRIIQFLQPLLTLGALPYPLLTPHPALDLPAC